MIIKGTLEYVSSDGMERRIFVKTADSLFGFSYLASEWEDEDHPEKYPLSTEVSYPVSLIHLGIHEPMEASAKLEVIPEARLLKAVVVGEVRKKLTPHDYLLDVGEQEDLPIHFVIPTELRIGSRIKVEGELAADQFGEGQ